MRETNETKIVKLPAGKEALGTDLEAEKFVKEPEKVLPQMFAKLGENAYDVLRSWKKVPAETVESMRKALDDLKKLKDSPTMLSQAARQFLKFGTIATDIFNKQFPDAKSADGNSRFANPEHEKFVKANPEIARLWNVSGIAHQLYLSSEGNLKQAEAMRAYNLYLGAMEEDSSYLAQAKQKRPDEAMAA